MRLALASLLAAALLFPGPHSGLADQHEVQWSARPILGVAQMRDEWASDYAAAAAAGMSVSVSYGVTNTLDLGVEALSFSTMSPTFDEAAVQTNGFTATGPYTRRSDSIGGTANATWRLGVIWVPIASLGLGRAVRYRSAGVFERIGFAPMETRQDRVDDWLLTTRGGIEYRMSPRWTLGAYTTLLVAWSPDAPALPAASLSFGLSYVHYPNL